MNTEHGHIRITHEVPLNYQTEAENEMARLRGLRAFECEGTCRECARPIYPLMACSRCTESKMCGPHANHKYECAECVKI
jgi:hypothetical protein